MDVHGLLGGRFSFTLLLVCTFYILGSGSAVGIATGYGLDNREVGVWAAVEQSA
jgi:hypothetical protein